MTHTDEYIEQLEEKNEKLQRLVADYWVASIRTCDKRHIVAKFIEVISSNHVKEAIARLEGGVDGKTK